MFKRTKIAVVLVMVLAFAALALSGCMPTGGSSSTMDGGGGADPTSPSGMMSFLPLILIIVVFYFILIRPQNKKNKQVNEMRSALKRGDWVTTIGGFRGRVVKVKDDLLTIEVGADKVKLEIMRWGISKIDESAPERKTSAKEPAEEPEEAEEEEKPKRKPKKLAPVPKKEEEPTEAKPRKKKAKADEPVEDDDEEIIDEDDE